MPTFGRLLAVSNILVKQAVERGQTRMSNAFDEQPQTKDKCQQKSELERGCRTRGLNTIEQAMLEKSVELAQLLGVLGNISDPMFL